jgi:hypothetical protein
MDTLHVAPLGSKRISEAALVRWLAQRKGRPQRKQAVVTRMLTEAGDGKGRSLAKLFAVQAVQPGRRQTAHVDGVRQVPLRASSHRERAHAAAKARSETWDPDFQYYYLPLSAVTPVKGLLRTPSMVSAESAPADAASHAFRLLIGDGAETQPPTSTQMLVVVVDEIVGDVFAGRSGLGCKEAHGAIDRKLQALPTWGTARQVVLLATCASKMPAHLEFSATLKSADISALREIVREGDFVESSVVRESASARAVLAEYYCQQLLRRARSLHPHVCVDIGGDVSALQNGSVVPAPSYAPVGTACALVNAVSWAYLRRSPLHLRLIVSSDTLTLSRALLRLEMENDLGGLALLAPVHIYLPRVDGKAVNVLTVRAQLETTPQRAATGAAAAIWAGSRLAGALATPVHMSAYEQLPCP